MNKKVLTKTLIIIPVDVLIIFLAFYLFLPTINGYSHGFYFFLSFIIALTLASVLFIFSHKLTDRFVEKHGASYIPKVSFDKAKAGIPVSSYKRYNLVAIFVGSCGLLISIFFVFVMLLQLIGAPLFHATKYASLITIEEKSKEEFDHNFSFDNDILLPIYDKELAFVAAQQKLSTYGAQYNIDEENFTIISVNRNGKDELVRVTPLEYSGVFVSLNKYNSGSIGYIEVNVVTKETRLVEVEGGMKYLPSAIFNRDLDRHIRFKYPTALYTNKYFEIDDEGKPYWIIPLYKNKICLFNGSTPSGVIVVDPVSGDMNRYKLGEEPKWIDRTFQVEMVENQTINALKYKNGFFNAHFGAKKDVFTVSEGYNYYIKNGRTYYVSCITSPNGNDETSIGFVTIDLKTREASKYLIPGITEYRACEIAMQHEDVKAQKLNATWPILIDYKGVPTYYIVLKNDVQDRKVVFVNVENGLLIAMGSSVDEAKLNYDRLINDSSSTTTDEVKEVEGTVSKSRVYGNDVHFMLEEITDRYFVVNANLSLASRFLEVGEKVKIKYVQYDTYNFVKELEVIG